MMTPIDRIKEKVTIVKDDDSFLENNTEDIISNVKLLHIKGSLVPVICEDMYEYEDPVTHDRQSLHSYIVEKVIDRFCRRKQRKIPLTEKELGIIVNESYYGMSLLRLKTGDLYKDIFNTVINEDYQVYDGICVKAEVRDFLRVSKPSLIVTTNCFPILEKELQDIGYESYWCELETKNDKPIPEKCIYHLFGEAQPNNSNWWGYNDKQLLKFLCNSYSSDYALKNLTTYINNHSRKTLLILGNDSPDWLFRFILTPIYGADIYDEGIGFYISEGNRSENGSLEQFLREIKFEKESQLIEVLKSVTDKIRGKESSQSFHAVHPKKYDFFVAHTGEDKEPAEKLVQRMRANGMSVWVDYENNKEGHYWQNIIDGLENSAFFIPLITEQYIKKCEKSSKDMKVISEQLLHKEMQIDGYECVKLEKTLEGVAIELLLAERWLYQNQQDTYSIPVILKGSEVYAETITPQRIRNWSENSRYLPQSLFFGLQMYEFDASDPESFSLDWNRYKSNMRR